MIEFDPDERAAGATYLQLVQHAHGGMRLGLLAPGEQLPAVRSRWPG